MNWSNVGILSPKEPKEVRNFAGIEACNVDGCNGIYYHDDLYERGGYIPGLGHCCVTHYLMLFEDGA